MTRFILVAPSVAGGILVLVTGTGLVWLRLALATFLFGFAIVHSIGSQSGRDSYAVWALRTGWALYIVAGAAGIVAAFSYLVLPFAVIVTFFLATWCVVMWHALTRTRSELR